MKELAEKLHNQNLQTVFVQSAVITQMQSEIKISQKQVEGIKNRLKSLKRLRCDHLRDTSCGGYCGWIVG